MFKSVLGIDINEIYEATGCNECNHGYKGRIAIQEVLELDDEIRAAISLEGLTKDELRKLVYTDKTITMLQDALIKNLNGDTNFEEVYRVIEMENDDGDDYKSELTAAIREARQDLSLDPVSYDANGQPVVNVTVNIDQDTLAAAAANGGVVTNLPNVVSNLGGGLNGEDPNMPVLEAIPRLGLEVEELEVTELILMHQYLKQFLDLGLKLKNWMKLLLLIYLLVKLMELLQLQLIIHSKLQILNNNKKDPLRIFSFTQIILFRFYTS